VNEPTNADVPRRTSRLGSLPASAAVTAVSLVAFGSAWVVCEPPQTQSEREDAGFVDAGRETDDVGHDDAAPVALDAFGPAQGDPCVETRECGPPRMICCANMCREPNDCL
jgi:hypothetical protein